MDGTPTIVSLTPGDTTIQIVFTYSGGTATPDDFAYSLNDESPVSMGTTVSPYTITGLTNGQSYSVVVLASINQTDYSPPSNALSAVPRTVPDAPTITTYTPGNGSLRIVVSPPASNGGSDITGYQYEITDGITRLETALSAGQYIITGLVNGVEYRVVARAVNVAGASVDSAPIFATPFTVPEKPVVSQVYEGNNVISVRLLNTVFDGGSPILQYLVSLNGGSYDVATTDGGMVVITNGISNGNAYTVRIKSVNLAGQSVACNPFTASPYTIPDMPQIISVSSGILSVMIRFIPPAFNGGRPLLGYKYTIDPEGLVLLPAAEDPSTTQVEITGLTEGATYTVRLLAYNLAGNSPISDFYSASVFRGPDPLVLVDYSVGNQTATFQFTAGPSNGPPIDRYEYSLVDPPHYINTGSFNTTLTLTGLENGVKYAFRIRQANAVGPSVPTPVLYITPFTLPSPPTIQHILAKNWTAIIDLELGFDGGKPLLYLAYTFDGVNYRRISPDQTTITLSNLNNYNTYVIRFVAYTEAGWSVPSEPYTFRPYYSAVDIPFIKRRSIYNQSLPKKLQYAVNVAVDKGKTRVVPR
jgi:titin